MPPLTGDDGVPSGFTPNRPFGVWGDSGDAGLAGGGNGVLASSRQGSGVAGFTLQTATPRLAAGVFGSGLVGVAGQVTGAFTFPDQNAGVYGSGSNGRSLGGVGVFGHGDTNAGVLGLSVSGRGVTGDSNQGVGVFGASTSASGVVGLSSQRAGVFGIGNETGVIGLGGQLGGFFFGDVQITGNLSKGGGGFAIDHPLDPANQILHHSFVESPERKNVYDGIAVCNRKGEAVVRLPKWLGALNSDFRYQLTAIGGPAPNLHVATELTDNKFTIGGGTPGLKVSWQLTGVRQDPWAKAHPLVTEEKKARGKRGRYLHPEEHGKPASSTFVSEIVDEARKLLNEKSQQEWRATDS
jgi:hypothetical protein